MPFYLDDNIKSALTFVTRFNNGINEGYFQPQNDLNAFLNTLGTFHEDVLPERDRLSIEKVISTFQPSVENISTEESQARVTYYIFTIEGILNKMYEMKENNTKPPEEI